MVLAVTRLSLSRRWNTKVFRFLYLLSFPQLRHPSKVVCHLHVALSVGVV